MVTQRIRTDGFIEPCVPSLAPTPPAGPGWVHEIKHDGYRLILRRDGDAVRLFTRRGHDWTELSRDRRRRHQASDHRRSIRLGTGV